MTARVTKKEQSGATDLREDNILIVDFGGQYTQLIARVTRELGVFCEIVPYDADFATIKSRNPRGVILSGGPESVTAENSPRIDTRLFSMGIPVLGICYGMQVMAVQLGGEVQTSSQREYGHADVTLLSGFELFDGFSADSSGPASIDVWMSHGDRVTQMPDGFEVAAKSEGSPFAAMMDIERQFIGIQFHPEVTHTPNGRELLSRFIVQLCGCQQSWQTDNIIDELCQNAAQQVGQDEVILGLSGGVDSSVLAALLHRAIGDRLTCVFVDNGLLRAEEATQVMQTFSEHLGVRVIHVDASQQFLSQLVGVTDPEQKRKVIGKTFIDVFQAQAAQRPKAKWLAQGTIYPDVIESAGASTGKAHLIKSHHNVGGLPDTLSLQLLEPLRDLFKDEVRRLGLGLGLPKVMINRHPFPGPGLAVRILGEVRAQYAEIIRHADRIFIEELHAANLYEQVSQAFAVFLPVKSVGVVGDGRAYEYVVALRAVETVDFMTAHWARLPYDLLDRVSQRIINEANNISRVTYDISGKPPATIEWE